MNKLELVKKLSLNYTLFAEYINSLSDKELNFQVDKKWNAVGELDHIVKSVEPLARILSKRAVIETFGKVDRPILTYDKLIQEYKQVLRNGGKATGEFVPEEGISADKRGVLTAELKYYVSMLEVNLSKFTESDLDCLSLPHPLLGVITIREMMYFTIYHFGHHQQNIEGNLQLYRSSC